MDTMGSSAMGQGQDSAESSRKGKKRVLILWWELSIGEGRIWVFEGGNPRFEDRRKRKCMMRLIGRRMRDERK